VEHIFELDEAPAGGLHVEVGLPVTLVATIANLKQCFGDDLSLMFYNVSNYSQYNNISPKIWAIEQSVGSMVLPVALHG
jgi:hypothetical protein